MDSLKEILYRNGFSFKKAFGQNFISDTNLLKSIVSGAEITKEDTVLEIGCGAGTLTRELALSAKRVIAYEIDTNLKPVLSETLFGLDNVNVIFSDIMKNKITAVEKEIGTNYKVVANLPYYITTPIIMRFIEQAERADSLVIMVQEEVADRLCAKPNTAEYGSITAAVNLVGDAKIIKRVPKHMFTPVPKVDSAVVRIDIDRNKYSVLSTEVYRDMLRSAFGNRRKMFVNNLMQTFKLSRAEAEELLNETGVSLTARGETLSSDVFVELTNKYVENFKCKK